MVTDSPFKLTSLLLAFLVTAFRILSLLNVFHFSSLLRVYFQKKHFLHVGDFFFIQSQFLQLRSPSTLYYDTIK